MSNFPHDRSMYLTLQNPAFLADAQRFLVGALESDLTHEDPAGDALGLSDNTAHADVLAKSSGVFCGRPLIEWLIQQVFPRIKLEWKLDDGARFEKGRQLFSLKGSIADLLKLERTLLNALQRFCGIATQTSAWVELARPARLAATRKTLYGKLDKYAVAVGGGLTHRLDLGDAPMFKDNHWQWIHGDPAEMIRLIDRVSKDIPFVTVEIHEPEQAIFLVEHFKGETPLVLLFDNFEAEPLRRFLSSLERKKSIYFEASGGINEINLADYAKTGVDVISVGALTHSVRAADLSMRIRAV